MPRPSGNTDQKLIESALHFLPKTGFTQLSLREVAAHAKVNLGMFHYHFKSKEQFTRCVLESVYESFFQAFSFEISKSDDVVAQLRNGLITLGYFSRDNRKLITAMISDVLNGNKEVTEFLKDNLGRHIGILLKLIVESQSQRKLQPLPPPAILSFLTSATGIPNLMAEMIRRSSVRGPLGMPFSFFESQIIADDAIETRVDLALKAVMS